MQKYSFIIVFTGIILFIAGCNPDKHKTNQGNQAKDTTINTSEDMSRREMLPVSDTTGETPAYYKILETGLKYHMHDYHPDQPYPNPGDIIYLRMDYYLGDSLLFTYRELPDTMKMRMTKPDMPGTIDEGLFQMHQYDSTEFILDANKFYLHTRNLAEIPVFINIGDSLRFYVRIMKIIPAEEWEQIQSKKLEEKREFEISGIRRYQLDHNLNTEKTDKGVYREITHKGSGPVVTTNSQVSMHYEGKFLNDNVFSSTYDSQQPFTFSMGQNKLIPGLEDGLTGMTEGSTIKLIIPFDLAYGEEQRGPIPPWSTLVFEVQIIAVR